MSIILCLLQLPDTLTSSLEQSLSGPTLNKPRSGGLEKEKLKELRDREKVEKRLTEVRSVFLSPCILFCLCVLPSSNI